MERRLAQIGFGEAARAFAPGLSAHLSGFDRKTDDPMLRRQKLEEFAMDGVVPGDTPAAALAGAEAVLSLVTADQALAAAEMSDELEPGAFWFDMNSVAPDTKRAAAAAIVARGGRYIDVAVMAPVYPMRTAVPLLVSGADAQEAAGFLRDVGFSDVRVVAGDVGAASVIKMIRSVVVKGIEALSAECALAADAAGVLEEVIGSLEASTQPASWAERFDYSLDRMLVHGGRRAAEMEEVVDTLDALGTGSTMSRGTVLCQRSLGELSIVPPHGLSAKLRTLAPWVRVSSGSRAA